MKSKHIFVNRINIPNNSLCSINPIKFFNFPSQILQFPKLCQHPISTSRQTRMAPNHILKQYKILSESPLSIQIIFPSLQIFSHHPKIIAHSPGDESLLQRSYFSESTLILDLLALSAKTPEYSHRRSGGIKKSWIIQQLVKKLR